MMISAASKVIGLLAVILGVVGVLYLCVEMFHQPSGPVCSLDQKPYSPVAATFYTPANSEYRTSHSILASRWAQLSDIPLITYEHFAELPSGRANPHRHHHWTGNPTKIDYVVRAMDEFQGHSHVIFMDCDVYPVKKIDHVVRMYRFSDLVCAQEGSFPRVRNIGFMSIKNTPRMKRFFTDLSARVEKYKLHDQAECLNMLHESPDICSSVFRREHVCVFPCLKTKILPRTDDVVLVKPIRSNLNKTRTKSETVNLLLEGSFWERLFA